MVGTANPMAKKADLTLLRFSDPALSYWLIPITPSYIILTGNGDQGNISFGDRGLMVNLPPELTADYSGA
ncbi:hypothetical protein TH1_20960 [Thalassospira lucentensis MCCC 1A00383 = DSM 14000]|nr:hypothetical protein TH1_20960 [Thalassospira lucentensis MCCC 1A00383 = DSM 14000]